ncbi:hypothetical protein Celaphus_00007297 [Cervus elaphus hippelaphus]|nr:hypothetical protein Celaphus_00007297 [Cervus elaphus hippelaphus]
MPKGGRKGGHKGRARQYTSPEEIDAQLQAEKQKARQKRKGVEGLIDIENPNRVAQTTKKVTQLDLDGPKELSRRER